MKIEEIIVEINCVIISVSHETYRCSQLLLEALNIVHPFEDHYSVIDGKLVPRNTSHKIKVEYSGVTKIRKNYVTLFYSRLETKKTL